MQTGFSKLDPQGHEGETNTWLTPLSVIKSLGEFDFDPCGFYGKRPHVTAKKMLVPPYDGLTAKWEGRVWMNPPYGRDIWDWISRLEHHGNGMALLFARTDTKWFHDAKPDAILFLKGRIKFLTPFKRFTAGKNKGKLELDAQGKPILLDEPVESTNAGHGSMLLAYGRQNVAALFNSHLEGTLWT